MIKSHHGCLTLYPAKRRRLFLRLAWQAIAFLLYFVMTISSYIYVLRNMLAKPTHIVHW